MKKLILLALVCAMAGACSKDSDSEDRLRKATVKGAVMAYQSAGRVRGARTGSDFSGFNTVDAAGNVKPIRFITDRGDTVDMFINKVEKVDPNFMLLGGEFRSQGNMYSMVLVDVRTEYYGQTNEKYKEKSRKSSTAGRKPITYSRTSNFGSKNEM